MSDCEFRASRCGERHTLLSGVNEFVHTFHPYFLILMNIVQDVCT